MTFIVTFAVHRKRAFAEASYWTLETNEYATLAEALWGAITYRGKITALQA